MEKKILERVKKLCEELRNKGTCLSIEEKKGPLWGFLSLDFLILPPLFFQLEGIYFTVKNLAPESALLLEMEKEIKALNEIPYLHKRKCVEYILGM